VPILRTCSSHLSERPARKCPRARYRAVNTACRRTQHARDRHGCATRLDRPIDRDR
jgi:hypothetical protein